MIPSDSPWILYFFYKDEEEKKLNSRKNVWVRPFEREKSMTTLSLRLLFYFSIDYSLLFA